MSSALKKLVFAVVALGFVAAAGGTVAFYHLTQNRPPPPPPAADIPVTWADVRNGPMHVKHLEAEVSCSTCHAATPEQDGSLIAPCQQCHPTELEPVHIAGLLESSPNCWDCHPFRPSTRIEPWNCQRCHESSQGTNPAIEVHLEQGCKACHNPHDAGGIAPTDCVGCHQSVVAFHGKRTRETAACEQCHGGHRKGDDVSPECVHCHSREEPKVSKKALLEKGHNACTACHQPHQRLTGGKRRCENCHDLPVLAQSHSRGHMECQNCHAPHDIRATSDETCAKCHDIELEHPAKDGRTCVSCHSPHLPEVIENTAVECTTCHVDVTRSSAAAATEPDAGGDEPAELALAEKTTVTHGRRNDLACRECHLPHAFGSIKGKTCEDCHAETQKLIDATKQHEDCAGCHLGPNAHELSPEPRACRTCHDEQAQSMTRGHVMCRDCHVPHRTEVRKKECSDCHEEQAKTKHGQRVEGSCAKCHRPHGPKGVAEAPKCKTCHERPKGLHENEGHLEDCKQCHSSHQDYKSDERARCLSCHEKLTDHEPTAKRCGGCHPFK